MTPKEKADELFNKMDMIIYTDQDHNTQCKRCALIAVNAILNWVIVGTYDYESLNEFWQEVKQEIEKL